MKTTFPLNVTYVSTAHWNLHNILAFPLKIDYIDLFGVQSSALTIFTCMRFFCTPILLRQKKLFAKCTKCSIFTNVLPPAQRLLKMVYPFLMEIPKNKVQFCKQLFSFQIFKIKALFGVQCNSMFSLKISVYFHTNW